MHILLNRNTPPLVVESLDVSIQTARVYINNLIDVGILKKVSNEHRYVYTELYNIFIGN